MSSGSKSKTKFKKKGVYYHCGKKGHYAQDCFKKKQLENPSQEFSNVISFDKTELLVTALSVFTSSKDNWFIDFGVSQHLSY